MNFFNQFQEPENELQDETEEYVVAAFIPRKIPATEELIRRQREEEIRKKYCNPSVKTGAGMMM